MATGIASKTVLVTGSAGEPKRAFALAFVCEGAGHVILVDINEARLAESKALIEAEGAAAFTYRVDLSVEAEIVALGEAVVAAHPRLDVLINNAGCTWARSRAVLPGWDWPSGSISSRSTPSHRCCWTKRCARRSWPLRA